MRVWAFPSFYPYPYPGMHHGGIFAHRQYKGLIANGAELKVILPVLWSPPSPFFNLTASWKEDAKYQFPLEREYDGIKVYHPRISNMKPGRIFRKAYSERYIDAILGFFKNNKIKLDPEQDIFYAQWLPDAGLVQVAAHKLGVKSAVMGIGDDVLILPHKDKKNFDFIDKTLSEADIRLAVAQYLADAANKLFHKNLSFHIIRRGVNYEFFKPVNNNTRQQLKAKLNLPADQLIILSVGSPIVAKGWIELLDALKEIKKQNDQFVLLAICAGYSNLDIRQEASKRGLQENYIQVNDVAPDKMNEYYNTADIFCLPSHTEGIANAVAEAMACGLPVLTTSVGGHPELITNYENGILVEPKNASLLFEKLQELISRQDIRIKLGANARNHIVTNWGSFSENSRKLYEILKARLIN